MSRGLTRDIFTHSQMFDYGKQEIFEELFEEWSKKKVIEKWNDRSVLLIYFLDLLGLLEVLYLHKISLRVKNANMFTSHFFKLTEMIR